MRSIFKIINLQNLLIFVVFFFLFFRFYQLNMPDIIEDEDGHIRDAIAFYNNDPNIVPRHHTFRHTKGNVGHPFFHHFLIYFSYKVFGPSNASSRLPAAIMSVISALVVYHLTRKMFNSKTALIAASLYLLSPLVFRVSRTAHIDNTFAAMGGLALYYFYIYIKNRKLFAILLTGLYCALLFSSKINGTIIFVVFICYLISLGLLKYPTIEKRVTKPLIFGLLVFTIIFLLFNDPFSYIDAIIHPADPGYNSVFSNPFGFDWNRLKGVAVFLFPWNFTILLIISCLYSFNKIIHKDRFIKEYLLLIISLFLFFTGFRFGLERGLMIFLIPSSILVGNYIYNILNLNKVFHRFILFIYVLVFIPYIILYGFRTKPLPFYPYDYVTHFYTNRLKIFNYLNRLPQTNITVSVIPSTLFFPGLNLRKGIDLIPVAFRGPKTTDYFLTDDWNIYQDKISDKNYNLIILNQYEKDLSALFERIN